MASTPHSYGPVTRHSRLTVLTATTVQLARQPWLGLFKLKTEPSKLVQALSLTYKALIFLSFTCGCGALSMHHSLFYEINSKNYRKVLR